MRRALLALPAALVVASCGDQVLTRGLDEPIAVHDAQFVEGPIPGLSPEQQPLVNPRPTAVTTEFTSLRPRLANVPFFGWTTLDAVSVSAQIEGLGGGHWVLPTGAPDPAVQGEPVRTWRFVADLHDALPPGKHRLLVAATDANGKTGSQVASTLCVNRLVPDNGNACDPAKLPPEIAISLEWDAPVDLDLLVVTPASDIIAARSPSKGLGTEADAKINRNALDLNPPGVGFLDVDSNANCHIDGRQIENVVFPNQPQPGSYLVYVNLHDACHQGTVRYTVSRHQRVAGPAPGTFGVLQTDRYSGVLTAIQANGSARIGTFVTELIVP